MESLPYWERLARGGFLSNERRMDRYRILYCWKVVSGLVPNFTVDSSRESRRGLTMAVPPITGTREAIKTLKERSLLVEGPRLFNSLPKDLRNLDCELDTFKAHLDAYLETLPDQPASANCQPRATDSGGRPSNSVRDWGRTLSPVVGA